MCEIEHEACTASDIGKPYLPRRLLLVKSDTSPLIRLVEQDEVYSVNTADRLRYATLSYRWGSASSYLSLKESNQCALKQGIQLASLSPLVQDAIRICRALGLDYLWVDALCIVQDSRSDWYDQAPQMADIFGKSHVCFAASGATDPSGTLIYNRSPWSLGCRGIFLNRDTDSAQEYVCFEPEAAMTRLEVSGMNRRGWIFQERLLAKRTIHFNQDQVYFECAGILACESHPRGYPAPMVSPIFTAKHFLAMARRSATVDTSFYLKLWLDIVELFSFRTLSYPTDRLMAISGVAEAFEPLLPNETYVAGHWSSHLLETLYWMRLEKRDRDVSEILQPRPEAYIAPSWSWPSQNVAVQFRSLHEDRNNITHVAEITKMDIERISRETLSGPVDWGAVEIRARLVRIHPETLCVCVDEEMIAAMDPELTELTIERIYREHRKHRAQLSMIVTLGWDADDISDYLTTIESGTVHLLELCETSNFYTKSGGSRDLSSKGLVVIPVEDQDTKRFRRVGTFTIHHRYEEQYHNPYHIVNGGSILAELQPFGAIAFAKPIDAEKLDDKGKHRVTLV